MITFDKLYWISCHYVLTCSTSSGEEDNLAQFAGLFYHLPAQLRPQNRQPVVNQPTGFSAGEYPIYRRVFTKVSHPAAQTQINQILTNYTCKQCENDMNI